jgi:hypothetical protein
MDNGSDDFYRSQATPALFDGSTGLIAASTAIVATCMAVALGVGVIHESQQSSAPVAVSSTVATTWAQSTSITPTVTVATSTLSSSTVTIPSSLGQSSSQ